MGKKYINGKYFKPNSARRLELARRSAELILRSKLEVIKRVNEETEIYPSLDIKTTICPTGIFRVVLMKRLIISVNLSQTL